MRSSTTDRSEPRLRYGRNRRKAHPGELKSRAEPGCDMLRLIHVGIQIIFRSGLTVRSSIGASLKPSERRSALERTRELTLDVAKPGIGRQMRFLTAVAALAAPSSAHAGRLLTVRVDGSGQTTLASDPKASFGPTPCRATARSPCWRNARAGSPPEPDRPPGAKARWKRPPGGSWTPPSHRTARASPSSTTSFRRRANSAGC